MRVTSILKSSLAAVMVASLLAAGHAWADDEGRGRGGDRGGGGERSSRSISGGGESRGGGERSSRSVSGGGERSSRSAISGGERSRSISGDSGRSSRSLNVQSRSRSSEGIRSSRGPGEGSSQFRGPSRTGQPSEPSTFGGSTRDSFRTGQSVDRSGESRGVTRDRSSYDVQRGQIDRGPQQYQARRPSEDQVRDFLQLRGDSSRRQAGDTGDGGEFRDGRSFRSEDSQRADVARRLGDSDRRGDEGRRDFGDRERGQRDLSDSFRSRDGDSRRGDADGDYQRWRDGARSRDDDHRDWSGKWRDGDRFTSAHRIRDRWRGRDNDDYPFYGRWWDDDDHWHGHRHWNWWGHYAHRYNRPYYWWTWTTAPRLSSWVIFGWPRPYYWDYGHGEYIYYDDGVVYVNGRWYQPGPVFYERTVEIVEQAPDLTPEEAAQLEWLPLGVFAVAHDGSTEADVLVQLAVTKDGVISGTTFDQRSGAAYPIQGMVDKQTQRAVWSYTNDREQRIVMETSIYNLTQPEATGLVHYGPNDFRVVELVRLEGPEAGAATTAELPAP